MSNKPEKDSLGDRMKAAEGRYNQDLSDKCPIIIRCDGKAFHTYTKNLKGSPGNPWSPELEQVMNLTTLGLLKEIQGARLAYVQSDEISIVVCPGDKETSQVWFAGNLQKMVSVSAGIASAMFTYNSWKIFGDQTRDGRVVDIRPAIFDSRAFSLPTVMEVSNYLIWRQKDHMRNSVQMLARSLYSHKQLQGKNNTQLKEMCREKGSSWDDLPNDKKFGRLFVNKSFADSSSGWEIDNLAGDFVSCRSSILTLVQSPRFEEASQLVMLTPEE